MRSLCRISFWLPTLAVAFLFIAAANADAQARVVRTSATTVRPNVNPYRSTAVWPAQPFTTAGNPHWYLNQNYAAYANPNLYISPPPVDPFAYSTFYPSYYPYANPAYNPYLYNPYAYSGFVPTIPAFNPYVYPTPYFGY